MICLRDDSLSLTCLLEQATALSLVFVLHGWHNRLAEILHKTHVCRRVVGTLKHLYDAKVAATSCSALIHRLVDETEFIEVEAISLLSKERLTVFTIAYPHYDKLLDCALELLTQVLILHTQRLYHVLLCQIKQRVAVYLILSEYLDILLEQHVGL